MKGNVIVALIVGAALGFAVGRATKSTVDVGSAPTAAAPSPAAAPTPPRAPGAGMVEDTNAVYKMPVGNSPAHGPATAKVTIVEVTDFECPFCSRANATMKQIAETYGKDVRIVVKQNPLGFHQNAHVAAQAALAAHEQGKYWEMHHKMFENQKSLDRASLEKYAQELGLDLAKFKSALDTQKFKDRIDGEQKLAVSLGAGGTPTFFINGRKVVGAQPFDSFKRVIDEEIGKANALLAKGVKADGLYEEMIKNAATSPVMVPGAAPGGNEGAAPGEPPAVQRIEVPDYSPFKGPKHAKVTIVEWSDFQCPFCSRGANSIKEVMQAYPNDVKFVFRHQPLDFHSRAMPTAKASMAANKQGKFWEMHDRFFANQQALDDATIEKYAKEIGLNVERFKADMQSSEIEQQITNDSRYGMRVGANGTPTFFVNGRVLGGAKPFAEFKRVIDEELARVDQLMKSGVKIEQVYDKITSMPAPEKPKVALEIGNSPVKGDKNAKVKIYEFSEFQCPFCSRAVPTMKQIEEAYKGKVAIIFKQHPLGFHDKAQLASEASLAAHEQGKFWEMHDKLFANQQALDRPSLEKYAEELGLNMSKFKAALDSGKFKDQVQKEMASAAPAGITGTPSFVINGQLLVGAKPFEEFKKVIDAELAK